VSNAAQDSGRPRRLFHVPGIRDTRRLREDSAELVKHPWEIHRGGLSNLYYPVEDSGKSLTLSGVAISLSYQMLGNLGIEFWPEIQRKVLDGDKKQDSPTHK
jgi:hypothetical protein